MKNVFAYARFSKGELVKGLHLVFEDFIKEFINKNKEEMNWELKRLYADINRGGLDDNLQFNIMCRNILENKVDIIIVRKIKDVPVNNEQMLELVEKLTGLGIEIIFIEEEISTFDITGIMNLRVRLTIEDFRKKATKKEIVVIKKLKGESKFELLAEKEAEEIKKELNIKHSAIVSENVYNKAKEKIKQQENEANHPKIYGYDFKDGQYIVNQEEAKKIKAKVSSELKSHKMKEKWKDENYRKIMIEKIKKGKEIKKRKRENEG